MKRTVEESASDGTNSFEASDDEFSCQTVRYLNQVKKIKSDEEDRTVTASIEDVIVEVWPDIAAEISTSLSGLLT